MTVTYTYDGKFDDIKLIVGQTGSGKTKFIQKVAKNNIFGEINHIFWLTTIILSEDRVTFISIDIGLFKMHLDCFQKRRK